MTDGTTAWILDDVWPGASGSAPREFVLSDGRVLFSATNQHLSRELYSFEPGATAQLIGVGCAPGLIPELRATDPVLGASMDLGVHRTAPGAVGFLLISLASGSATPLGSGCELYVSPGGAQVLNLFFATGDRWTGTWALPPIPILAGLGIELQAVVIAPASPSGYDLTGGVQMTLGN